MPNKPQSTNHKHCRRTHSLVAASQYNYDIIMEAVEGDYGELATVDAVRQVRIMKALKRRSEDRLNELAAKDEQILHRFCNNNWL